MRLNTVEKTPSDHATPRSRQRKCKKTISRRDPLPKKKQTCFLTTQAKKLAFGTHVKKKHVHHPLNVGTVHDAIQGELVRQPLNVGTTGHFRPLASSNATLNFAALFGSKSQHHTFQLFALHRNNRRRPIPRTLHSRQPASVWQDEASSPMKKLPTIFIVPLLAQWKPHFSCFLFASATWRCPVPSPSNSPSRSEAALLVARKYLLSLFFACKRQCVQSHPHQPSQTPGTSRNGSVVWSTRTNRWPEWCSAPRCAAGPVTEAGLSGLVNPSSSSNDSAKSSAAPVFCS